MAGEGIPIVLNGNGFRWGRFSCSAGVMFAGAAVLYFGCSPLMAMCLTAALLHELGHMLLCVLLGIPIHQLRLTLLGAVLTLDARSESGMEEILIALAGPLVNLVTAGFLLTLPQRQEWMLLLTGSSLLLGIFNLLPVAPLDGSRVLHGILSLWDLDRASWVTAAVTRIGCLLLLLPGVFCGIKGNPSLLMIALWILLREPAAPTGGAKFWRSFPR